MNKLQAYIPFLLVILGLTLIAIGTFLLNLVLGLVATGIFMLFLAFILAPASKEGDTK